MKPMKKPIIPFLAILLCVGACHRNNNNNATPSNALWGDLRVQVRTADSNFVVPNINDTTAFASFYRGSNNYYSFYPVTSVTVNGRIMDDNGDTQYVDNPRTSVGDHVLWEVVGGPHVPSFTYDNTGIYPSYTGSALPDTMSLASGFTMSFPASTIPGGNDVSIVFDEFGSFITREMDANRNIVVTPQDMATLGAGQHFMNLQVNQSTYKSFDGKTFYFAKERIYMKTVVFQ